VLYRDAAAAWLSGADPWAVGPPAAVFSGPPTLLLPFVPFVLVPELATRIAWVAGTAAIALWTVRRIGLPGWWIGFPPIFSSILLGHPEILILTLLVLGGAVSGLAAVLKPYAGFALLAEQRWRALAIAAVIAALTVLLLPWPRFLSEAPTIMANLARQSIGDSAFGQPVLTAVAVMALLVIGPRRGLWLATPVVWPFAQPIYKVMTVPQLSPVIAIAWSLPIPGATLAGIVAEAALLLIGRWRALPAWLSAGIGPVAPLQRRGRPAVVLAPAAA
jgi:hypothetical protein